jgi:cobalt-zinc-cadmium efflux system outer membrane protein
MKHRRVLRTLLTLIIINATSYGVEASDKVQIPLVQESLDTPITEQISDAGPMSLRQAITLALTNNPDLQESELLIGAREARASQEGKRPNPELDIEFDNFAGSGPLSGFKGLETTIGVGQTIELGNKRGLRVDIADTETEIAALSFQILRLDIITEVRKHFTEVLGAQQKLELNQKLLDLAGRFNSTIDTLVSAGRYSPAEKARAQVEYSTVQLSIFESRRNLKSARLKLASTWGGDVSFNQVEGNLIGASLDSKAIMNATQISENARVRLSELEVISQRSEAKLAEAMRIPDPTIGAGFRRFSETSDRSFVTSLSIPIPVLNRNQGSIQEAHINVQRSEQALNSTRTALLRMINLELETIQSLEEILKTLEETIIPEASKAYEIINRNYRLGQYSTLDVLDAQRKLFEAQVSYLDMQLDYNISIIELEGLLGHSVLNQ